MNDALFLHRIHFAFTITFHYLFPQLTMGLAPLIVPGVNSILHGRGFTYSPRKTWPSLSRFAVK
jgi:cytochrome bd-type quinol oxidase subunit 1